MSKGCTYSRNTTLNQCLSMRKQSARFARFVLLAVRVIKRGFRAQTILHFTHCRFIYILVYCRFPLAYRLKNLVNPTHSDEEAAASHNTPIRMGRLVAPHPHNRVYCILCIQVYVFEGSSIKQHDSKTNQIGLWVARDATLRNTQKRNPIVPRKNCWLHRKSVALCWPSSPRK